MMSDAQAPRSASASAVAPPTFSSASLEPFLEISPDALVIVDQTGTISLVNRLAENFFGYTRSELLGRPLKILLPQRFHASHAAHLAHYFAAPRTRPMGIGLNLVGRRKDGSEFPVEISLNPLLLDGELHALASIRDVSAQRAIERERLQQAQHIRLQASLINLARDAILVRDGADRVLSWNKGAQELYGWTEQEALGRVTPTLLQTRFPVDPAEVQARLERDGQWEGELVQTCRDGRIVTVESRQVLVRLDGEQAAAVMEIDRDVTRRHEAEQAERAVYLETTARLTFLQQVLDALPSGVYLVYGHEARLLLANRAAAAVFGAVWPAGQPMQVFLVANGITLFDAQGHPLPPEQYATLRAVRQGETVLQQQETIRRPGGSRLPVLVSALPLPPQPGTGQLTPAGELVALVVQQDVTALKEAEDLKDEFVGIVAHELRTPLSALRGFADMLLVQTARGRGPHLADWQQEALGEIETAVTRLVELTEELLDVTRLQAGRLLLQRTPTDVVALTRRVATFLGQTTTRHQVQVSTEQSSLVADIDSGRIEQVLTNLIGNAIKYSPQGGPIIITLCEEAAGMVKISVADRGIGIPKAQQAQIFGRFMRADNAQAWGISGTGLGLYICRELVERHGGQLWFESEEDRGSTFFLTLPLLANQQGSECSPV
jgi:PAS domain S-box-containing protein